VFSVVKRVKNALAAVCAPDSLGAYSSSPGPLASRTNGKGRGGEEKMREQEGRGREVRNRWEEVKEGKGREWKRREGRKGRERGRTSPASAPRTASLSCRHLQFIYVNVQFFKFK